MLPWIPFYPNMIFKIIPVHRIFTVVTSVSIQKNDMWSKYEILIKPCQCYILLWNWVGWKAMLWETPRTLVELTIYPTEENSNFLIGCWDHSWGVNFFLVDIFEINFHAMFIPKFHFTDWTGELKRLSTFVCLVTVQVGRICVRGPPCDK